MKKKITASILCLLLAFSLVSCGNKDNSSDSASGSEADTSADSEESLDITDSSAYYGNPVLDGPSTEESSGTEETKSEGLNTAPGTVVKLEKDAVEGTQGETYSVSEEDPHFTLTVDSIALTDTRTDFQEADRVICITYTYHNLDMENLMIGQYSFRMLNEKGEACEIYYFDATQEGFSSAMPVEKDGSCTAAVGFIADDAKTVTVLYDDQTGQSDTEIYWTVDLS